MRNSSWNDLVALIDGKKLNYRPVGFIIDSPWIPGWYGISVINYYSSDELWLKSNVKTDGFLHNDAEGLITAKSFKEMGVNVFNFSFNHSLGKIRELSGPDVVLVGNIPPRDVLELGTPVQVNEAVRKAFGEPLNHDRIVWSAGGGMPPDVKDENINAFIKAVNENP